MDPNNLLTQAAKWRAADVSLNAGGDMEEALGRITCANRTPPPSTRSTPRPWPAELKVPAPNGVSKAQPSPHPAPGRPPSATSAPTPAGRPQLTIAGEK